MESVDDVCVCADPRTYSCAQPMGCSDGEEVPESSLKKVREGCPLVGDDVEADVTSQIRTRDGSGIPKQGLQSYEDKPCLILRCQNLCGSLEVDEGRATNLYIFLAFFALHFQNSM